MNIDIETAATYNLPASDQRVVASRTDGPGRCPAGPSRPVTTPPNLNTMDYAPPPMRSVDNR